MSKKVFDTPKRLFDKPKRLFDVPEPEVVAVISDLDVNWSDIDKKYNFVIQSATLIAGSTHNPVKYDENTGEVLGLHDPEYMYGLPGYEIVRIGHSPVAGLDSMLAPPVMVFKRPAVVSMDNGTDFEVQGSPS